ncbi:MAG: alpha/beta fold hydrolase [Acidobacteriia bacterium]|nr:alpha/beta fold hydrolase [Terriglobia bacterium]
MVALESPKIQASVKGAKAESHWFGLDDEKNAGQRNDVLNSAAPKMHYLKAGSGPPLLLVHGLLGGSFCWRFNLPELAARRTVYAVDMAGLGLSDASRYADCSMAAQAARLGSFIHALRLGPVDVVASSWGGAVALLLAATNANVRSLILAAPVNPWSAFGRERVSSFSGRLAGFLLPRLLPFSRRFQRPYLERLYGDPHRIPSGTIEGYAALITRRGRGHNLLSILRGWQKDVDEVQAAIPRVKAPTRLIWGSQDRAVDPASAEALQRALPGSALAVMPGVGHLPFEESPAEFNRLVLEFLAKAN